MEQQTLPRTKEQFNAAVLAYLTHIKANYAAWESPTEKDSETMKQVKLEQIANFTVETTQGPKYLKVVKSDAGVNRSVHCFIDAEGLIWKPASWNAPTKNFSRGSIFEPESYRTHRWSGL